MVFLIDVTGTCNLRCPSCPVGNFKEKLNEQRVKGFMPLDYFYRVIEKIKKECPTPPPSIHLYNWGESLIHPQIENILKHLHDENISFTLSSNLNVKKDLSFLIDSQPDYIRVSVSGFYQEMYKKYHKGGNIELVKNNLIQLRKIMDEKKINVFVYIFYLIYKDNCDENILKMYEFCQELNFGFFTGLAYLMPLENMIYAMQDENLLSAADKEILNSLCFTPKECFEFSQNVDIGKTCELLEHQVVINFDGSVPLCCAVYEPQFCRVVDDFLQYDLAQIQQRRRAQPLCRLCVENKLNAMVLQAPMNVYNRQLRRKQLENATRWPVPYLVDLQLFNGKFLKTPFYPNPAFKKE